MIEKCYFDGEAITARGSTADTFFFIKKGNVSVMSINCKEIKGEYKSGDIFGLAENLANAKYDYLLSELNLELAAGTLSPKSINEINGYLN